MICIYHVTNRLTGYHHSPILCSLVMTAWHLAVMEVDAPKLAAPYDQSWPKHLQTWQVDACALQGWVQTASSVPFLPGLPHLAGLAHLDWRSLQVCSLRHCTYVILTTALRHPRCLLSRISPLHDQPHLFSPGSRLHFRTFGNLLRPSQVNSLPCHAPGCTCALH